MYTERTIVVKPLCTPPAITGASGAVHDAYMAKKSKKARATPPPTGLRPLYQKTFIKEWRLYKDMSQGELAQQVSDYLLENEIRVKGYTYASIGRMENGRIPYSQPIMEGISKALGVSVATLIAIPPPSEGEPLPPDPGTLLKVWSEGVKAAKR